MARDTSGFHSDQFMRATYSLEAKLENHRQKETDITPIVTLGSEVLQALDATLVDAKAALKRIGKVRMATEAKLLQTKTAKVKGSSMETETWKKNLTATSQWSEVNAAAGVLMQMGGGQLDNDLKDIKRCLTVYKQVWEEV